VTAVLELGAGPSGAVPYDLSGRYRLGAPPMRLTGVQVVARVMVEQLELDGRRFVSGYPGSTLGGLDQLRLGPHAIELSRASDCPVVLKIAAAADGAWVVGPEAGAVEPVRPLVEWQGPLPPDLGHGV
jgi:hypothetical protein